MTVVDAGSMTALRQELAGAGVTAYLHARDLDSGAEEEMDADAPVVLASVFKVPVAVELARQVGDGRLDEAERIVVPAAGRTAGGTGLSALVDEVEMSLRDLAQLMISVSDNAATDVVAARVGVEAVNASMRALGLTRTFIEGDCAWLLGRLADDLGLGEDGSVGAEADEEAIFLAVPAERWAECRELQAPLTNRSTPREMTRLLQLIWADLAAPPAGCALVRRIMGQQVWPHRLRSGFEGSVRVSAKTGTLPFIRNEVGVVEYPGGGRYAVAVFTVADRPTLLRPDVDRLIGVAARVLVDRLRA